MIFSDKAIFSDALDITLKTSAEALMSAILLLKSVESDAELFLSPSNILAATSWVAPRPFLKF